MHPQRPPDRLFPEEAACAHERVRALLDGVVSGDTAALSALRTELPRHFAEEQEVGGLFDWIEALLPDARTEIARLEAEHAALLTEIASVEVGLSGTDFARRMSAHERCEEALRQRAHRVGISGTDADPLG